MSENNQEWMDSLRDNIYNAIIEIIEESHVEEKDMLIYMPPYFSAMYSEHLTGRDGTMATFQLKRAKTNEYRGVKVVDGYENLIVIAAKDSAEKGIEPIKIPIP